MTTKAKEVCVDDKTTEVTNRISRQSWFSQLKIRMTMQVVRLFTGYDSTTTRVVRFYVKNTQGTHERYFDCPYYLAFDPFIKVYKEFTQQCYALSTEIAKMMDVPGDYWYDIRLSINNQGWTILKTNNPRCIWGDPIQRKDCSAFAKPVSYIHIFGYGLNSKYKNFLGILSDFGHKTIIVHNRRDMVALFKVMKFVGVSQIERFNKVYPNTPKTWRTLRTDYGYHFGLCNGKLTAFAEPLRNHISSNPDYLMDIDEFIVKRSVKSRILDFLY